MPSSLFNCGCRGQCDSPFDGEPTLQNRAVMASKTKCGHTDPEGDENERYLRKTRADTGSGSLSEEVTEEGVCARLFHETGPVLTLHYSGWVGCCITTSGIHYTSIPDRSEVLDSHVQVIVPPGTSYSLWSNPDCTGDETLITSGAVLATLFVTCVGPADVDPEDEEAYATADKESTDPLIKVRLATISATLEEHTMKLSLWETIGHTFGACLGGGTLGLGTVTITKTGAIPDNCKATGSGSYSKTEAEVYDPETCETSTECAGSFSGSKTYSGSLCSGVSNCTSSGNPCTTSPSYCGVSVSIDEGDDIYSEPYTTEALISAAEEALGEWPEEWDGGGASASRDLTDDEITYSLQRAQGRVVHYPTASCYLKIWLRTRFEPEGGGDPVLTDLEPYVWSGSGTPCFPDAEKGVTQPENLVVGPTIDLDEPSEDGDLTMEIVKFSCLPGFEPDGLEDSGYPQ